MTSPEFNVAKFRVKLLETKPSDNELLQLYALFKVAEKDDIKSRPAPGMFDFKEKEKRKAWQKLVDEGVTPEQAEKKYIDTVNGWEADGRKFREPTAEEAAEIEKLKSA